MCQCPASFFLFRLLVVVRAAVFAFAAPPAFFLVEDFLFIFELLPVFSDRWFCFSDLRSSCVQVYLSLWNFLQ